MANSPSKMFLDELQVLMDKYSASFFVTNSNELKKRRSTLYVSFPGNIDIELGYLLDALMIKGIKEGKQ